MSSSKSDSAGRFVITPIQILERFLITGSAAPKFSVNDKFATFPDDTKKAIQGIFGMYPQEAVNVLRDTIDKHKAPRRPPVLLALAAALNNPFSRKEAEDIAINYIRSGTDQFVLTDLLLGWGRGKGRSFKRFASTLYRNLDHSLGRDKLAENLVKYRSRAGWSHRDLLRVSHYKPSEANNDLFAWAVGKGTTDHELIVGYEKAKHISSEKDALALLKEYPNLPWEALPTECLVHRSVWEALLPNLGFTALLRNLGRMSSLGVNLMGQAERLTKPPKSIHPVSALSAFKVYSQGRGERGSLTWNVNSTVKEALNTCFDNSFKGLRESDAKVVFALDVSGSMDANPSTVAGLSCREACAAMMMAAMRQQPYMLLGFSRNIIPLEISHDWPLDRVIQYVKGLPFSSTAIDLPMRYAMQHKIHDVDLFAIYTDNEVNTGGRPVDALRDFRKQADRFAKLAVLTARGDAFSVADPNDVGMMDFVGMDASAPETMLNFAES